MKTYIVGGAVRDKLLGLPVSDRDHVVVGATVDDMLAAGFKPVGRDFPVFLHPVTHEEYALARTERKVAPGYAGFVFHADPGVTLEEDLARRDLTINAIAEDDANHRLIDPFDGQRDLGQRVFRHVGPAFVEDAVRILRLARFAARFADFSIADETLALMRAMAARGEADALVPERIWQEISRGLAEQKPSRMIAVLREAHALARVLPEVDALFDLPRDRSNGAADRAADVPTKASATLAAIDRAAAFDAALSVRFAALTHAIDDAGNAGADTNYEPARQLRENRPIASLCSRLGVPAACRDLALMVSRELATISSSAPDDQQQIGLFERCDAFRRPARFEDLLLAVRAVAGDDAVSRQVAPLLARNLARARAVDAGAIARQEAGDPARIAIALRAARVAALKGHDR